MDTYIEYFQQTSEPDKQYILVPTERLSKTTRICYVFVLLGWDIERVYEMRINEHYHLNSLNSIYRGGLAYAPIPSYLRDELSTKLRQLLIERDHSSLNEIFFLTSDPEGVSTVGLYWLRPIENQCLFLRVSNNLEVLPEHLDTFAISDQWQNLMDSMTWKALVNYDVPVPPKETVEVMMNLSLL